MTKKNAVIKNKYAIEKTTTQQLRCLLTDAEKLNRSGELADNLKQLQDYENELADFKNTMKAKTAAAEGRCSELAEIVRSGYEFRKVDCLKTENYESGYVTVIRTDTCEVIENRPMNAEERQRKLNLFPESEEGGGQEQSEEFGTPSDGAEGEE